MALQCGRRMDKKSSVLFLWGIQLRQLHDDIFHSLMICSPLTTKSLVLIRLKLNLSYYIHNIELYMHIYVYALGCPTHAIHDITEFITLCKCRRMPPEVSWVDYCDTNQCESLNERETFSHFAILNQKS